MMHLLIERISEELEPSDIEEADQKVANVILKQLGGNKFLSMTGAKNLVSSKNSLSFRLPGVRSPKPNHVTIKLNGSDTYDVQFGRIRGINFRVVKSVTGVGVAKLREVFTRHTGLSTSL